MGGLLVALLLAQAGAAPPLQDTLYDLDRVLVPASRAAELPALLAQHRHIRLESANYCGACPTDARGRAECGWNITVGSGMSIQGLPGTQIPSVVVEPGSSGVLLSNLDFCPGSTTPLLYFPPAAAGSAPTRESSFIRLHGVHVLFDGAAAEDLLFVDLGWLSAPKPPAGTKLFTVGGIHFGPGSSVLNSRFIRSVVQAAYPTFTADLGGPEPSEFRGNVFLFQNSNGLTLQASFLLDGADELTIVGSFTEECECNNGPMISPRSSLMPTVAASSTDNAGQRAATVQVRRSGDVRLAGLAGVLKCRKTATLDRSAALSVWLTRNASHYQTTSASLPGKTLGSSTWTPRASSISCRRSSACCSPTMAPMRRTGTPTRPSRARCRR